MLEHMGLDIEEFQSIEPSLTDYPWQEHLPRYMRKQYMRKKKD